MEKPTIQEVETWLMKLYTTSQESITPAERREQNMYATMVEKPSDKKFLVKMLDESSQIRDDRKLAKRIKVLIDEYGVPEFLNARDRLLFKIYQSFGYHFYPIAIPIIKKAVAHGYLTRHSRCGTTGTDETFVTCFRHWDTQVPRLVTISAHGKYPVRR